MKQYGLIAVISAVFLLLAGCGQSKEDQERAASKKTTQAIKTDCVLSNPPPENCTKK